MPEEITITAQQKRKVSKVKHDKIMAFLAYYVNFENQDMMRIFEKEVQQLTGRTTPMGVKVYHQPLDQTQRLFLSTIELGG